MIKSWVKRASQNVGDFRIFTVRRDYKVSPRTGVEHDFYVIDAVNWVNVLAVTPNQELVMVDQYRHGSNTVELEIPGGMMDGHEARPEITGERELREETGYAGDNARVLGQVFANPAMMSNTCFTVLIENCRCVHPVQLDHGEDIMTRLVPIASLPDLVANGTIRHPYVTVSLYYFDLWQRGLKKA